MRYVIIAVVIYAAGIEIYKAVRARAIDYLYWAIVGLFGVVIWLSTGFLITCQMYDWVTLIVCLLTISCYIVPKEAKLSRWIRSGALACLSLAVVGFVSLDIIAKRKDCITIETSLNGYSTARIDEIYFRYNGKSFGRTFNLRDYSGIENLRKDYNVELIIIPITADIAKIESLDLVQIHELMKNPK